MRGPVWRPSRKPVESPKMAAAERSPITAAMFNCPAPATTPTVNSSESPGRKKPTSSPVSEYTMANNAAYPSQPESSVLSKWIKRSGSVSERRKSMIVWIIRLAGPVTSEQPGEHIRVDLDLPLLNQSILHSGFKDGVAVPRFLAF